MQYRLNVPAPGASPFGAPAAPQRKAAAAILMGVPDDQRARMAYRAWDEQPGMLAPGMAGFRSQMRELPWDAREIFFGAAPLPAHLGLPRFAALNYMADADLYRGALTQAAAFVEQHKAPCFNHPLAILDTGRDAIARRLQGIEGLHVPRTVRVRATLMAQLQQAVRDEGMTYPVLFRMAGDHTGANLVRIEGENGWEAANALPWGGRDAYITQYVDYRDADGLYRKTRIAVIGSHFYTRHLIVAKDWMVHTRDRMAGSASEESAWMLTFAGTVAPKLAPVIGQVIARLKLDYFGMDVSLRPDGTLLLFEANASMDVLRNDFASPSMWDRTIAEMGQGLYALIGDPRLWWNPVAADRT